MSGGAYRKAMESLYGEAQPGDNALQEARDKYARKLWNLCLDAAKKAMPRKRLPSIDGESKPYTQGWNRHLKESDERLDALKEKP